ncbi:MAG: CDP-alcohol phosphatidyltransferase family protein [Lachnospiraceae bacterium]|nr:CDP-alcohol phosphatidyltransferase family protein [Lachnospiraceae bacterium]
MEESRKRFVGFYNPSVILTYLGVLCAFISIYLGGVPDFKWSIFFLMLAGVCDMFDGTVARMVKRSEPAKKFGIQLDSICDICCFGITPALLGINLSLETVTDGPWLSFIAGFCLTLCGIIRLAYFNVMEEERQSQTNARRSSYQGLPITSSAIMAPVAYLIGSLFVPNNRGLVYCAFEFLVAFLFIFNLPWPKPHGKQFIIMIIVGLALFTGVFLV